MANQLERAADFIFRATWQAAILIVLVLILRMVLRSKVSPAWWCALWLAAGAKFILPAAFATSSPDMSRWLQPAPTASATVGAPSGNSIPGGTFTLITLTSPPANAQATRSSTPLPHLRWKLWLAIAWLAVALFLLTRRTIGEFSLARQIRKMPRAGDPRLAAVLDVCAGELRLRRPIHIVETSRVRAPAIWGFRRPVLFLPSGFIETASDGDLRLVILHELIHVARADVLVDRAIHIIRDFHWFNPLAWLWLWMYAADRELACDRAVLTRLRQPERECYGHCLLRIIERVSAGSPARAPASIGLFHSKFNIIRRINMISSFDKQRSRLWNILPLCALLALGCAAVTSPAQPSAQPPPPQPQPINPPPLARDSNDAAPGEPISAQDHAMAVLLDQKLPELEFNAIPLSDVLDNLRNATGANIFVNWRALEAVGVDRNAPVTARLRDIKFKKALSVILADAGGSAVKLGFVAEDGVITVSTEEDLHRNVTTRVYDVRDLIVQPVNFTPPNQFAPQSTTQPAPEEQPSRQQQIDSLITLIIESIAPDTWRQAGGTIGSIQELSGQLIITQIPENQKLILALLDQLRETRAVQVLVEARFLMMNVKDLPGDLKSRLSPALADKGVVFLDSAEADSIVKKAAADVRSSLLAAPRVILFNGQRAYVSVGSPTAYVSNYVAIKSSNGDTRFEPQVSKLDTGLLFDVMATASADRKYVTLSLNPRDTKLLQFVPEPWSGAKDTQLLVQKPVLSVREAATTVTVPDGKVVVLTATDEEQVIEVSDKPTTRTIKADQRLFVFVKPTLIIQREQPAPSPLISSKSSDSSVPPARRSAQ